MHGLKQGTDVLTEIHKELNIDSVEKLLEDTHEAQAYQQEISEMLAGQLSNDEEEAVQDELAALELEVVSVLDWRCCCAYGHLCRSEHQHFPMPPRLFLLLRQSLVSFISDVIFQTDLLTVREPSSTPVSRNTERVAIPA